MRKFTNPLDNIHVASPCPANWDEMYGSDRKRFCGDCKLNVYNLSNMTRHEAETLLINSEGRLCVRFFRRADGTVLTKNCPVGWKAVTARASRVATAAFSMLAGVLTGVLGVSVMPKPQVTMGSPLMLGDISPEYVIQGGIEAASDQMGDYEAIVGEIAGPEVGSGGQVVGRVVMIEQMDKKKVVAWVK